MKRLAGFLLLIVTTLLSFGQPIVTTPPDKIYGKLFVDVQMNKVFPDGRPSSIVSPNGNRPEIIADYEAQKETTGFDLKKYVLDNFDVPAGPADTYKTNTTEDVATHIKNLWPVLRRTPDKVVEGSSLLPLPYPYIVPRRPLSRSLLQGLLLYHARPERKRRDRNDR